MPRKKQVPARDPEVRENQLIALAVDLAEKKLRDGTASSQIITTLLNLATTKYKLEMKRIESDIRLKESKAKSLLDSEDLKELYAGAIDAMRSYRGHSDEEEEGEDWDDDQID